MADLTKAQRAQVRRRIAEEQRRTAARALALERDLADIVTSSADAVRDDEHDPEGATIAFERAQVAALLAEAEGQRTALEEAARAIEGPTAGGCAACGEQIGLERLLARPSAATCVRCAGPGRRPRA